MNEVSLKIIGNWSKEIGVPLRDALAVSMDVIGKTGEQACRQAIIFMATSLSSSKNKLTPQSKKKRPVERDAQHHNTEYVNVWHKGKQSRFYRWNFLRDSNVKGTWEQAQQIKNSGLARRSWLWGLKGLGKEMGTNPIPGVANTISILGDKACGYILRNSLSYMTKILPAGWEATVSRLAGNRIMGMARAKIERQWQSEMRRSRRGGINLGRGLATYFTRAA